MAESTIAFASAVGAGIAAGVFSSAFAYWFERRKMRMSMMNALEVETKRNLQIARLNTAFERNWRQMEAENSVKILFIPFHHDVWRSIINHGLLNVFDKEIVTDLTETYNLIYELNAIISANSPQDNVWLPISPDQSAESPSVTCVATLVFSESARVNERIIDLRRELGFERGTRRLALNSPHRN